MESTGARALSLLEATLVRFEVPLKSSGFGLRSKLRRTRRPPHGRTVTHNHRGWWQGCQSRTPARAYALDVGADAESGCARPPLLLRYRRGPASPRERSRVDRVKGDGIMRLIGQIALVLVMFLGAGPSAAQDSQYWTQKYGTRGLLLSGVVIGHGVDLSTTFYNPGGLALLSDSMSVIAVKAYDFSNVKIVDATLTGKDLSEPRNSVLPTFFGGTTPFRLFGSSPLAYSLFPRQLAKFNMNARGILVADALPQAAGPEDVVTEARFEEDLDETWGGVTWSKRIG